MKDDKSAYEPTSKNWVPQVSQPKKLIEKQLETILTTFQEEERRN